VLGWTCDTAGGGLVDGTPDSVDVEVSVRNMAPCTAMIGPTAFAVHTWNAFSPGNADV